MKRLQGLSAMVTSGRLSLPRPVTRRKLRCVEAMGRIVMTWIRARRVRRQVVARLSGTVTRGGGDACWVTWRRVAPSALRTGRHPTGSGGCQGW